LSESVFQVFYFNISKEKSIIFKKKQIAISFILFYFIFHY